MEQNRAALFTLLCSILVISLCGLGYELLAGTISSYFLGNSVLQFSLTIGVFLCAMGLGSYLSSRVDENLLEVFLLVEILIGLIGGSSAFLLFFLYAYTSTFMVWMFLILIAVGALVGIEIPLMVRILKDYGTLKITLANVLSFDYLGALLCSILFPLLILPSLGLMHSSFFFGLLNMVVVFFNLVIFQDRIRHLGGFKISALVVTLVLSCGLAFSFRLVSFLESRLYVDEIILTRQTRYQRIVLTRYREDLRLYLDGNIQFCSLDEYRYHEVLVHPAMSLSARRENVLILGGGDGLAAREVLRFPGVKSVTLVDIDKEMVDLCSRDPFIGNLNQGALRDPRVKVVIRDAFKFLEETQDFYDCIIVDLPDPNNESLAKLYTRNFYLLLARRLAKGGMSCIQSTSPFFAPQTFWCIYHTVESTGLYCRPMHTFVPSFGDWGFVLASHTKIHPELLKASVPARYLNPSEAAAIFSFPQDMEEQDTQINTLNNQVLLRYYDSEWKKWE